MKLAATTLTALFLSLAACGPDAGSGDSKPEANVPGVSWSGHGIRLKHPEGMRVMAEEGSGRTVIEILEEPTKPSSVSVALHLLAGTPTADVLDLHRETAAAQTRKGLEADGVKFAPNAEIEREIAGVKRKGTVLEFDFGPAHYHMEWFSIDLGGRLVGVVMRFEPHEKEIALKAFDMMAKTLAVQAQ